MPTRCFSRANSSKAIRGRQVPDLLPEAKRKKSKANSASKNPVRFVGQPTERDCSCACERYLIETKKVICGAATARKKSFCRWASNSFSGGTREEEARLETGSARQSGGETGAKRDSFGHDCAGIQRH